MVLQCCGGGDLSFGGDCGEYVGAEVAIFNLVGAQLGLRSPRSGVFYFGRDLWGLCWAWGGDLKFWPKATLFLR